MTSTLTQPLRASSFKLEPLEGLTFAGYTTGHTWNGWACPLFTKAEAERIVEAWHTTGYAADYEPGSDMFRFGPIDTDAEPNPDLGDEEVAEQFGSVEIDGLTLYRVGAGAWVWEDAKQ